MEDQHLVRVAVTERCARVA